MTAFDLPNLAGVATEELVEKVGGNGFSASYINWSRTMHLLREHAPGWLPRLCHTADGNIIHRAPVGAYLLICFEHVDGRSTPPVPQAIMDNRNNAIPFDRITARDVTDTHRRGVCMAAALTFGLAYELWAKIPLESGFSSAANESDGDDDGFIGHVAPPDSGQPHAGVEVYARHRKIAATALEYAQAGDIAGCLEYLERLGLATDDKVAVFSHFPSNIKSALKKAKKEAA